MSSNRRSSRNKRPGKPTPEEQEAQLATSRAEKDAKKKKAAQDRVEKKAAKEKEAAQDTA